MSKDRRRRWFQLSLKSLFLLTLVVAAFFAGHTLATRQAEADRRRAELEARRAAEEVRLKVAELLQALNAADTARGLRWISRQQAANVVGLRTRRAANE